MWEGPWGAALFHREGLGLVLEGVAQSRDIYEISDVWVKAGLSQKAEWGGIGMV